MMDIESGDYYGTGFDSSGYGMMVNQGQHAHQMYREAMNALMRYGQEVEVRGFKTKEIINYITIISEPWHHCHFVPGRRWNPWIAMSEALWIMAGRQDIEPLLPYNSNIKNFSDDGVTIWGAYGKRIAKQIPHLITRLEKDSNDRRAVLSIWEPRDLQAETKDPPCNDMVMFKIRKNKLHMTVINRSNDIHWGLYAVNIPTFGILMDWLAARLGVEMGFQVHMSNSLHLYTAGEGMKPNIDITKNMMYHQYEKLPELPPHERAFTAPVAVDTLVKGCNDALDGAAKYNGVPFLEFAQDFLLAYRSHKTHNNWAWLEECRHQEKYADWMEAARIWIKND